MRLFLLCSTLLLATACKKNISYTIKGTVTDLSLSGKLQNATVELLTYSQGNTTGTVLQSSATDSEGNYSFTFDRDRYDKIEIKVIKNNYFSSSNSVLFSDLTSKEDYVMDLSLYARSWVKLRFMSDGNKDAKYIRQEGKKDCDECCTNGEVFIYNASDTSIYCINNGNTIYRIYYNVLGSQTQGPLSTTTVAFDTTELLINY